MFHRSTQSPEQPVFIFQFRNLKKSTISLSHVITRLFNLLANYPMQRNRALSRHGSSESGYFTTNVNSAGIRIDGWNSNTANGFSNSIATRNPPLPASGTAIVFSIRFGRLVLSFSSPIHPPSSGRFWQFMLRETRSGTYCVSIICLPNIRSVNREGWSYQEEDFPFFFTNPIRGLEIYFDKVLNISSFNRRKFWRGRFIKLKNIWIL